MSVRTLAATLAAFVWCGAAEADVTARYARTAVGPPDVVVHVGDSGDSFVGDASGEGAVTTGGVTYIVMRLSGELVAVRQDDMRFVLRELAGSMVPDVGEDEPDPGKTPRPGPEALGSENVGGRAGTRWKLGFEGPPDLASGEEAVFVVSEDSDLASVGAAMARSFDETESGYSMSVGGGVMLSVPPPLLDIIRRGTLIRMGEMLYFHGLETEPVPASAFALPPVVLDRDRFRERVLRELLTQR